MQIRTEHDLFKTIEQKYQRAKAINGTSAQWLNEYFDYLFLDICHGQMQTKELLTDLNIQTTDQLKDWYHHYKEEHANDRY